MSLGHRVAFHLFSEPPQIAEPCLACKRKIINSHAMFQCGHTFHLSCYRANTVHSEWCSEYQSNVIKQLEQLSWKNMSREGKIVSFYT
jgi:hypothetical protein